MQKAIEKADTLIEALGWIRKFRDKTTVIKIGGSVLDNRDALRHILLDILFMETVGMRPVVVHGGGDRISREMEKAGIEPVFVRGRRYTDQNTLEIVERVLAVETNEYLANEFEKIGGRAMTLNFQSTPVLFGKRTNIRDDDGNSIDLGFVGEVTRVDRLVIDNLCYAGQVPFIPSMCLAEDDQKLNVNADTAATVIARQLNAEKLVFLSDVAGVMLDQNNETSLVSTLGPARAKQMIDDGTISNGMIPKIQACLDTIRGGVGKVHIVDGTIRHSLLLEIYTTTGVGTLIVDDPKVEAM